MASTLDCARPRTAVSASARAASRRTTMTPGGTVPVALMTPQCAGAAPGGMIPVALSAVDLALWDMLGKRASLPVADLLGRATDDVPICGVGGYAVLGATPDPEQAADELARYIELGAAAVKMTIGAASPA